MTKNKNGFECKVIVLLSLMHLCYFFQRLEGVLVWLRSPMCNILFMLYRTPSLGSFVRAYANEH